MSALGIPVLVTYTVTASGQPAEAVPATPLQVSVAQVHLGLKGDPGDIHPSMNGLVLAAQAAANAAAQSAAAVDLGALGQAVTDSQTAKGEAEAAAGVAATKAGEAAGSAAAIVAMAATLLTSLPTGAALPGANQGPIWHDDYATIMTWRTIGAYTGYASVDLGQVAYFDAETPPTGWLECAGQVCTDAALNAFRGTNVLRDLRGEIIRGWDHARGVDTGRVFGSAQAGSVGNHSHTIAIYPTTGGALTGGVASYGTDRSGGKYGSDTNVGGTAENRMRNVALLPCIKR